MTGVATVVKNAGGRTRALEGLDAEGGGVRGGARRAGGGADERRDLLRRPRGRAEDRALLRPAAEPRLRGAARARAGDARRLRPCRRLRAGGAGGGRGLGAGRRRVGGGAGRWRRGVRRRAGWPAGSRRAKADAFDAMAALAAEGRRFGLVVCDPPAFAPNKAALEAGLRAYERVARLGGGAGRAGRLPRALLLQPRGRPAPGSARRRCAAWRGPGGRRRSSTSAGPGPTIRCMPSSPETAYLKALFLRLA